MLFWSECMGIFAEVALQSRVLVTGQSVDWHVIKDIACKFVVECSRLRVDCWLKLSEDGRVPVVCDVGQLLGFVWNRCSRYFIHHLNSAVPCNTWFIARAKRMALSRWDISVIYHLCSSVDHLCFLIKMPKFPVEWRIELRGWKVCTVRHEGM